MKRSLVLAPTVYILFEKRIVGLWKRSNKAEAAEA
jgi:hypothetical protein